MNIAKPECGYFFDLNVQVPHLQGVAFEELAAGFDGGAHEDREDVFGLGGVLDEDLLEHPPRGVHRGFPELLGVHLAKALESLDLHAFLAQAADGLEDLRDAGHVHRVAVGGDRKPGLGLLLADGLLGLQVPVGQVHAARFEFLGDLVEFLVPEEFLRGGEFLLGDLCAGVGGRLGGPFGFAQGRLALPVLAILGGRLLGLLGGLGLGGGDGLVGLGLGVEEPLDAVDADGPGGEVAGLVAGREESSQGMPRARWSGRVPRPRSG